MAVLALARMVSFISIGHSSYNELPSDYLSKPSFSLCYIQHHSLCEHHHNETGFVNTLWLFFQQPTSEWSSLSLPVKEILLVIYAAFKCHSSIIFQRIPFVSWIQSSNLINIIHQSIQYPHALISSSYYLFAIEIPHGSTLFIPSTLTSCSRSIWSATHSFKHTPIHNHWSIHLQLLFLPLFAIHGSNNTCSNSTHTVDSWHS